ncbi:periplasmic binding protein modulated with adenosylcobinamide aminohydrolase, CbiZ [Desulfosarcina variabilis str. Montpellier]
MLPYRKNNLESAVNFEINNKRWWVLILVLVFWSGWWSIVWASPVDITDDAGQAIHFEQAPKRVVSLVPSATEIIFAIGAEDALRGITYHSASLRGAGEKILVGGFFSPAADRITALRPDLVIVSSLHSALVKKLDAGVPLMVMQTRHMDDAFRHIKLLGTLFDRPVAADHLITKNRQMLDLIAQKVAAIPQPQRKRVMRLMGSGRIMTPGNDSFQNEMIKAAGGIPPDLGKSGAVVPVTPMEWAAFNPQVVYGCGTDGKAAKALLQRDGWNGVDAVKNHKIYTLPCDLTCRAGAHLGDFVAWLASLIYTENFSDPGCEVLPRKVVHTRPISIDLPYVKKACVATSTIQDFTNKSLIVDFKIPLSAVSTLEGEREGLLTIGNHYSSPPCWPLMPMGGLEPLHQMVYPVIDRQASTSSFLFTGADMDKLAVKKETFKAMTVYALVTAGVRGNAVRMGTDTGNYYEPGTINMIFLTNMRLSKRAMTRAIISATEGKSAALQDLDIRSSFNPLTAAATGTGTDNIIVVDGQGPFVDNAGGHCKMGELIARAAYAGVREAIAKQNGIIGKRDVFQRLRDRQLSVSRLAHGIDCNCRDEDSTLAGRVEQVLLDPTYAGFLEAAMAISDGADRQTINNFEWYGKWCLAIAGDIAGQKVERLKTQVDIKDLPTPLAMAIDAVFTGVLLRER